MLVLQDVPEDVTLAGLRLKRMEVPTTTAKFDLTLSLGEESGTLAGTLGYSTDLFDAATVDRFSGHLVRLLAQGAADAARPLSAVSLLGEAERAQLLAEWNDTGAVVPRTERSLQELFAVQAARRPDAPAVLDGERELTFAELDRRSNRLARVLREAGVRAESRVALCMERSVDMVVGLLAALKAGGAFVVVDPGQPVRRVRQILTDSAPAAVLVRTAAGEALPAGLEAPVLRVEEVSSSPLRSDAALDLGKGTDPGQLAYVVYTSGSTGAPKGILVTHGSVLNLLAALESAVYRGAGSDLRVSVNAPFYFDGSIKQVIQLLAGRSLCIVPDEVRLDPRALLEFLSRERVDVFDCTPAQLRDLLEAGWGTPGRWTPGRALVGGEALDQRLWYRLRAIPQTDFFNVYGPSECTVDTTVQEVRASAQPAIGRPLPNVRAYVMSAQGLLQPHGVPGELFIGGAGLARGYHGEPGLTAERFVPDPHGSEAGGRLYRTGDGVRYRPDGTVEFLGRLDHQVKVRGFRIELGEIESCLGALPGVADVVVVVRERSGEKVLVAYVVAAPGSELESGALREALRRVLPDYMIPGAVVFLPELPLTANGKVDRKALPEPEETVLARERSEKARTVEEELLAGIWEEVLGVEGLGREESFFDLGGHSLLATQVVSRVRQSLGVDLPVRALFESPTVASLAARVEEARGAEHEPLPPIPRADRSLPLPLSLGQRRLWFLDQLEPESAAYNVPVLVRLDGPLDEEALRRSLSSVVGRHEVLRTRFEAVSGEPVQVVSATGDWPLERVDLSDLPKEDRERELLRLGREEAARPFDLAHGPLCRGVLVVLAEDWHALVLVFHHIVCDGWSMGVLLREVGVLYAGRALPELSVQYGDFAAWQAALPAREALGYWRERLSGASWVLDLPTDRPRRVVSQRRAGVARATLDLAESRSLRQLGRDQGATLFMVLLAGYQALLGRLSGQSDLTVGTVVAGRLRPELEDLIGFFVNTLALRAQPSPDLGFGEFLAQVRGATFEAFANQELAFERLVEDLQPERSLSYTPLFQTLFVVQNAPLPVLELPGGLRLKPEPLVSGSGKFDLTLSVEETESGLRAHLEYDESLFEVGTATRWLGFLRTLLNGAMAEPERALGSLPVLSAAERWQLVREWTSTSTEYPRSSSLVELFAEQAARRPEAVALESWSERLSYGELDRWSNRIANRLLSEGVAAEELVGLSVDRSAATVAGLLGVLKAGGAYLPLDPWAPAERLGRLLAGAGVERVLSDAEGVARLSSFGGAVLDLDAAEGWSDEAPGIKPVADQLAYVLFTSGSTGRPKGVAVSHRSVVRLVRETNYARFGPEETCLLMAPLSFDASTMELWGALLNGGRLAIALPGMLSLEELGETVSGLGVTTLWLTAGLFHMVAEGPLDQFSGLRQLLAGGDVLSPPAVQRVLDRLPGTTVINGYGPTEGTTFSCCHRMEPGSRAESPVPIGRAISNTWVYALDVGLEPSPVGVPGELFIGGAGLARGYHGEPGLTAERFVPDPHGSEAGGRLYRTGDGVRYRPDGTVEFLGRLDHQVKVRGFRIELGEIESCLGALPGVADVVVVVRERSGEKVLVAYVVAAPGSELESGALREALRRVLPDYMIPGAVVFLPELPLTANGKVDRKALPEPEETVLARERSEKARTVEEELLAGIWEEVLGVEGLGREESFFDLGGHSLLATQVVSRVRQSLGVDLPVRALFESPTVASLAARVEEARGAEHEPLPPIPRADRSLPLPLSLGQRRLWFLDQLEPESAAYNVPVLVRLDGPLDEEALRRSLSSVVGRHEVLRTRFEAVSGEPVQVVSATGDWPLERVDLSDLPKEDRERELLRLGREEAARPFDLAHGPLCRGVLVVLAEDWHALVLVFHHIVCDGWSMGVLLREVGVLYAGRALPELSVQYGDFAAWQAALPAREALGYWRERLSGASWVLDLPTDRPRRVVSQRRAGVARATLDLAESRSLRQLGRDQGATLFMVLLAGYQALLGRLSGQSDLTVGTVVAGRLRPELEDLIGFFVNTLALRAQPSPDLGFGEFLAQVRGATFEAFANQELAFERLVEDLQPERSLSYTPLFQTLFVVQNAPLPVLELPGGLRLKPEPLVSGSGKFDLTLSVEETESGLRAHLEYDESLFEVGTATRWLGFLRTLLNGAMAEPERALGSLPVLSAAERWQLVREWTSTSTEYPRSSSLVELFAEQAARRPEAVALESWSERLSYGELDRWSNRIANRLLSEGVAAEELVGLSVDRSAATVAGLLGVLKAGGAYLPLDPWAPAERLGRLLAGAGVERVLSDAEGVARLSSFGGAVLDLDAAEGWSDEAPGIKPVADQLAYVLFTSGSTGRPKGVAVSHRSVVRLVRETNYARFGPEETCLLMAPLSFDASTMELWGALLNGGRLAIALPGMLSLEELGETVSGLGVTTLWLTAGLFHMVAEGPLDQFSGLRQLLAGGDVLSPPAVQRVLDRLPGTTVINGYGPTEGTTFSCCHRMEPGSRAESPVPIGRAISNTWVYALDVGLEPSPVGVPGELFIGGAGLARGYHGEPGLTAERFVPDPHGSEAGGRLYRTGDGVRYRPDGTVEFLGRLDHQVKVRGFRIELGEIESCLGALPGVADVVVVVRERSGEKVLVAYVVAAPGSELESGALREALRRVLPDYMIPGAVVFLPELPLTANGKVDRKALPEPEETVLARERSEKARTVEEELLAGIWEEVLGVEGLGREESFFDLGGHSLLATQVVSRVRQSLGVDLPVRALFESPTVASLAARVEEARGAEHEPLPPIPRADRSLPLPLSLGQRRLWFLDQLEPESAAYNLPLVFRLRGALDPALLARSLSDVASRHEVLRTSLPMRDGQPVQEIAPPSPVPLPVVDLSALPDRWRETVARDLARREANRPFVLAKGPLWRVLLVRFGPLEHQVFLTMHHIISDGWSFGVFFRELATVYRAYAEGGTPALPALPVQYVDYAVWQRAWLRGEVLAERLGYWRSRLAGVPPLQLPMDRPRGSLSSAGGASVTRRLSPALAHELHRLGRQQGASLFMTLLAAFQVILHRQSGQEDLAIGFPAFGRKRQEIESLIGFFVNTLVLRCQASRDTLFLELLARVRADTLEAYLHEDLPFDRVVEELQPERSLDRIPLFQVFFNMLNFPHQEVQMPGLSFELMPAFSESSKFDLTLYTLERDGGLELALVYNRHLFDAPRMRDMMAQLDHLLSQIVARPETAVGDFSLVAPDVRALLPDPSLPLPAVSEDQVHERLAFQALRGPDRVAVEDPNVVWTYRDVAAKVDRLARALASLGIGRGDVVALYSHRSAPLAVALIGILKAGAAFAVLDPTYPPTRLAQVLTTARPRALVRIEAAGDLPAELEEVLGSLEPVGRVVLSREGEPAVAGRVVGKLGSEPVPEARPDDLAYVAFTSGSTGRPKGILGTHRPLGHFLRWHAFTFSLDESDRFSLLSGLSHDPLLRDVFTPLWLGATLCIPAPGVYREPAQLAAWLGRARISVAHLSPALAQQLADAAGPEAAFPDLRYAFFGGDRLRWRDVARLLRRAPRVTCVNCYGATETPQVMGFSIVSAEGAERFGPEEIVPVDGGIEDVQLLVLNAAGQLCGVGELGEICIRTPYLSRGYLGDEELTRERFVPNPWGTQPDDRLYRTGDLGRYLPGGQIAFAGRADSQLQIRGFRVELGDVEAALLACPGVRMAAVRLWEGDQGDLLAGYFVEEPEARLSANGLLELLGSRLPEPMVPAALVKLDALPLTANGKVDRRALPEPLAQFWDVRFVATETPAEQLLAGIWTEVLGVERVGLRDHFFRLGGHSLKATQVMSRIREVFQVELPIRELFEAPTLGQLAQRIRAALGTIPSRPPLVPLAPGEDRPFSFTQHRLWFLDRFEPQSSTYNLGSWFRLDGPLDPVALARALATVARRHETLRTSFPTVEGRATLKVLPPQEVPLPIVDLGALADPRAESERLAAELFKRPFDLKHGRLLRACLLRQGEELHSLVLALHHIVSDGWSMGVLIRELATLYSAPPEDAEALLAPLPVQYTDYAAWQRSWLQGEELERLVAFWRGLLIGVPQVLELPTDRQRPPVRGSRGGRVGWLLPLEVLSRLTSLGRERGATLYMILLAAFTTLLHRLSGQDDLLIGSPIANRPRPEFEPLIGFFANTLVLRSRWSGSGSFLDHLDAIRETSLAANAHQEMPFERLVQELQVERDLSRTPLFQVMLTLQNTPLSPIELPSLAIAPLRPAVATARFDWLFELSETGQGLVGSLEYSEELFDRPTVMRALAHFGKLLRSLAERPEARPQELALLSEAERHQLLAEWNDSSRAYPAQHELLHGLIEGQCARLPEAEAVRYEGESLTYRDLDRRSNRLARHLQGLGVGPEMRVGIAMERSLDLSVALLGVLKAGAAYVPFDPEYPAERLAFMLADSGVRLVLSQERIVAGLPSTGIETLCLDSGWDAVEQSSDAPVDSGSGPAGGAYMIYTSGSTGQPKGALNTHVGIVNRLLWMQQQFGLDASDRVLQKTPLSFDVSVWELFWPLLTGATLVFTRPGGQRDGAYLVDLVREQRITTAHFVPSMLEVFLEEKGLESLTSLRRIVCSGEALPPELAARCQERLAAGLYNLYGPTESAVDVTIWRCEAERARPILPIGRPISNLRIHLLDRDLQPVPIGVTGELHIGGVGLARNYHGRSALTAEKFIPDPFGDAGGRLYRTGDLARHRPDGAVEYLGRIDHQVKVRGFRIELGEIESVLAAHPAVRGAAVLALCDMMPARLVAYLVADAGAAPTVTELRRFLGERLPDYMVPALFVFLEAFPVTANGKLDRRALPVPSTARPELERSYVAPRKPIEEILADVWSRVLRLDQVGAHDNFFDLGGDSILSIQIVAQAAKAGLQLTPRQVFEYQTVEALAAVATQVLPEARTRRRPVSGPVRLTPIQHWFFEHGPADPHHFNQAVMLKVTDGVAAWHHAAALVFEHHDALRLGFTRGTPGDAWRQEIAPPGGEPPFHVIDLGALPANGRAEALTQVSATVQGSLDLGSPLVRFAYFDLGVASSSRLLVAVHHLAIDGVSWRILVEDLESAVRGEAAELPERTTSYQEWAESLHAHASTPQIAQELAFWTDRRWEFVPPLPLDMKIGDNLERTSDTVTLELGVDETRALLKDVPAAYGTFIQEVLLTALVHALRGWTGEPKLLLDLEGHGREEILADVDTTRTVGWMTSVFPVLLELDAEPWPGSALKSIKEQLRGIPNRGIGYGLLRYMAPSRGTSERLRRLPAGQLVFNYLGQFDQTLAERDGVGFAPESPGPLRSPAGERFYLFEVGASIVRDRLAVTWKYSRMHHLRSTVQGLAESYLEALRSLIAHCSSGTASGYTASDFTHTDLDEDQLERILRELELE